MNDSPAPKDNISYGSKHQQLKRLSRLMDSSIPIPGTSLSLGLDSILGLIPGVGDVVTSSVSLYLIYLSAAMGVRWSTILKMIGNIAIDTLVGSVPLIGDLFDIAFKSNVRNVALVVKEMEEQELTPRNYSSVGKALLIALGVVLLVSLVALALIVYLIISLVFAVL